MTFTGLNFSGSNSSRMVPRNMGVWSFVLSLCLGLVIVNVGGAALARLGAPAAIASSTPQALPTSARHALRDSACETIARASARRIVLVIWTDMASAGCRLAGDMHRRA